MGSIATTRGDLGQTGLAGGIRVSKASLRVDTYGTVDELISTLGFARSICDDRDIAELAHAIQRELFKVGSALATPPESVKPQVPIEDGMVERLTVEVHRLEAVDGILRDWSVSGAHAAAAAFDVARTVCRRAERRLVTLSRKQKLAPALPAYLNRLSDLLFVLARELNRAAGQPDVLWQQGKNR